MKQSDGYLFGLWEQVETEVAGPKWIKAEVVDRYHIKTAEGIWVPVYVLAPARDPRTEIVGVLAEVVGEGELRSRKASSDGSA